MGDEQAKPTKQRQTCGVLPVLAGIRTKCGNHGEDNGGKQWKTEAK